MRWHLITGVDLWQVAQRRESQDAGWDEGRVARLFVLGFMFLVSCLGMGLMVLG